MRPNAAKFYGGNRPRAASFNIVLVFRKVCNVDGLIVCYRLTYKVLGTKCILKRLRASTKAGGVLWDARRFDSSPSQR
jgi:hypothetical protein